MSVARGSSGLVTLMDGPLTTIFNCTYKGEGGGGWMCDNWNWMDDGTYS